MVISVDEYSDIAKAARLLISKHGIDAKARSLADRSLALTRWARGRRFDRALGHGSNDVTIAASLLRIPSATMFDYEWATVQHNVNCRLAAAVVVPDAIPPERLYRYGARGKILDVCCGPGVMVEAVLNRGCSFWEWMALRR